MFVSKRGVDNTSLPFYRQSILTPNFASSLFGPFFLSSSLQLIAYSLVSVRVCLRAYFYATKICIRCRPSLYIFHSLIFYIFSIFAGIEFKVSLLISLLYTPNSLALFLLESPFDSRSLSHLLRKEMYVFIQVVRGYLEKYSRWQTSVVLGHTFKNLALMGYLLKYDLPLHLKGWGSGSLPDA